MVDLSPKNIFTRLASLLFDFPVWLNIEYRFDHIESEFLFNLCSNIQSFFHIQESKGADQRHQVGILKDTLMSTPV